MKKLILLLTLLVMSTAAYAQKMVIGSKVPELRGLTWLSSAPQVGRAMVVDFYNPNNSSSARFIAKLSEIKSKYGSRIEAVVVIQSGVNVDLLPFGDNVPYSIGYDHDGRVFQSFNVQYLPYTIVINSKGELFWQGNLSNITDDILNRVE